MNVYKTPQWAQGEEMSTSTTPKSSQSLTQSPNKLEDTEDTEDLPGPYTPDYKSKEDLEGLRKRLSASKANNKVLRANKDRVIDRLKIVKASLEKSIEDHKTNVSNLESELKDKDKAIQELQTGNVSLEKAVSDQTEKIKRFEIEYNTLKAEKESLEKAKNSLSNDLSQERTARTKVVKDNAAIVQNLKVEMQALTTKYNASEKAATVQADIATEKDKGKFLIPIYPANLLTFFYLSVSTKANDSLKLQITTLEGAVKKASEENHSLSEQLQVAEANEKELKKGNASLIDGATARRNTEEALRKENSSLAEKFHLVEANEHKLKQENAALIAGYQTEIKALRDTQHSLEDKLRLMTEAAEKETQKQPEEGPVDSSVEEHYEMSVVTKSLQHGLASKNLEFLAKTVQLQIPTLERFTDRRLKLSLPPSDTKEEADSPPLKRRRMSQE